MFAKAREKARQSSCQSNVKQLAVATLSYLQDYDERFPRYHRTGSAGPNFTAQSGIMPYMKSEQLFVCPSGSGTYTYYIDLGYTGAPTAIKGSYGWNRTLDARAQATLTQPTATCMWSDARDLYTILQENNYYRTIDRHNDGGNMCYADGHAKWMGKLYLKCGDTPSSGADWDVI